MKCRVADNGAGVVSRSAPDVYATVVRHMFGQVKDALAVVQGLDAHQDSKGGQYEAPEYEATKTKGFWRLSYEVCLTTCRGYQQ